jgi:nucleotide-binding universal stress UspA family protein
MIRKPAHDFVNPRSTQDPIQLRRILFCTDFSLHSETAFARALSVAMEYGAELTLPHVLEQEPSSADLQNTILQVQRQVEEPVPPDVRSRCAVKSAVRIGKPYEQIIQLALEEQADMVILGVRGRSALDLAQFGSTSYRVIQLGPCPVLAVHV